MTAVHGARQKRPRRAKAADGDAPEQAARHDGGRTDASVEEQIAQKQPEQEEQQDLEGNGESDEDRRYGSEEDEGNEDEDEDEDDEDDDDDDEEDDEDEDEEEAVEEDDEGSPLRFLENIDPNWFKGRSQGLTPHPAPAAYPRGIDSRSPAASADDTEFYGAMIQMLTHVLGSSDSVSWPNQPTPGSQLAPSPFAHPYSSPAYTPSNAAASLSAPSRVVAGGSRSNSTNKGAGSKAELTKLQPMIDELIARLRKDQQQPTRQPVGEQDLTALLQTLMQQQQRQQDQQARQQGMPTPSLDAYSHPDYLLPQQGMMAPISLGRSPRNVNNAASFDLPHSNAFQPMQFADLEFEEEDEDDPDFNPDLNPDFPFPSAWSMAVQDVVASEESRAAAAAAAVAASHSGTPSGTQTPADVLRADPYRPGNLSLAGSMEHLAPRASSAAATGGRRPSFEPPPAESSRRPSQVQPSPSVQVASVPSSRPARNEDRWSPRRDASTPAPSFADARPGSRTTVPDHLMSPSGRPVRTSRKRPASPTPASPPRPIRMEAPAPSSTPPENEADAEAEAEQNAPKKRGRKAVLEPGEAARRRAQRNIEYQRARRQAKKAEESEQTETVVELKAEVRVLRAEIERLRDENATLRAQRELDRLRRSNGS